MTTWAPGPDLEAVARLHAWRPAPALPGGAPAWAPVCVPGRRVAADELARRLAGLELHPAGPGRPAASWRGSFRGGRPSRARPVPWCEACAELAELPRPGGEL